MLTEIYNNLGNILRNYWSIIQPYKIEIFGLLIILFLAVVYTIVKLIEYRMAHHQPDYQHRVLEKTNPKLTEPFSVQMEAECPPVRFLQPGTREYDNLITYWKAYYFPKFNQPNIQARGFANIQQLTSKYIQAACEQITEDDQERTRNMIAGLFLKLKNSPVLKDLICKCLGSAYFARCRAWLETGMPHTHGRAVIMPETWFNNPTESTFIHELAHIHQRFWPEAYEPLFNEWGFIRGGGVIKGLEQKVGLYRLNPDGLDMDWMWKEPGSGQLYWIASLFTSLDPVSIRAVEYLAFPVSDDGIYLGGEPRPLATFPEFQIYFNIKNNHYHPNEIAAQYFEFYLDTQANSAADKTNPAYSIFKQWVTSLMHN